MLKTDKRNFAIDLIKAFAVLGVVAIHIGSALLQTQVASPSWIVGLFWGTLFRASVPLFLMASGAIMIDSDKKLSLKKLFFRNITRIVVAMLVWGFAYKMYHLVESGQMSFSLVWYSIKRLFLFDQEFHFYYMHMIIIVYLFLPITRLFCEKADKKLLVYALVLWALLGIVYPTLREFKPFNLLSGFTGQWAINLTFASIGYGILGYYIKKYTPSFAKAMGCFCVGFFMIFAMTFYLSQRDTILNELFLWGTSPGVCLLAIGIFSLSFFADFKGTFKKIVTYISKASFCIYLSHMFIIYILKDAGITAQILTPVISLPLLSVCVLLICLGVYWVISKIPVLNRWIV